MNNAKINLSLLALLLSIGWFIISFIFNEDPLGEPHMILNIMKNILLFFK